MRFAADENFSGHLYKGLLKRIPALDIVRIQDTTMLGAADSELLEWLTKENRVLLTHDIQTIPKYFYQRVEAGLTMPGIIEVKKNESAGYILDELEVLLGAGTPDDFANVIQYVPL